PHRGEGTSWFHFSEPRTKKQKAAMAKVAAAAHRMANASTRRRLTIAGTRPSLRNQQAAPARCHSEHQRPWLRYGCVGDLQLRMERRRRDFAGVKRPRRAGRRFALIDDHPAEVAAGIR